MDYSIRLANVFESVSKKYGVTPKRIAAIAMQESGYVLNAKQCYKIHGKIRCDFCMMQINDRTAKNFGFSEHRLMTDLPYCVSAGARVLADLKHRYGHREKDFWSRYNATDPAKRQVYKELVERFM